MRRDRRVSKGPHIYRRGRVYWAFVDRDHRYSLGTTNAKEAAEKLPGTIQRAKAERASRGLPGEEALDVIAKAYLDAPHGWSERTRHTTRLRVTAFVTAMGKLGIFATSLISPQALDAWRAGRMGRSRVTINRDEIVASQMLAWAVASRRTNANPFAGRKALKEPRRRPPPVIPSPAETRMVVASLVAAGDRGAALTVATAAATGLRLDELRHIPETSLAHGALSVIPERGAADEAWQTKSYRERSIPLTEGAERIVRAFIAWRSGKGRQGRAIGVADSWIAEKIDEGCKAADVPTFRMHDMRRMFATEAVRRGVPITEVRVWLGHRDVATTERYLGRYRSDALVRAPDVANVEVFELE